MPESGANPEVVRIGAELDRVLPELTAVMHQERTRFPISWAGGEFIPDRNDRD